MRLVIPILTIFFVVMVVITDAKISTYYGVRDRESVVSSDDLSGGKMKREPKKEAEAAVEEESEIASYMRSEIDTIKLNKAKLGLKSNATNYYKLHKRPANKKD